MLKEEEIQKIDTYLKNQGIRYRDLRVEITDHLACLIEEKLEEYPYLSFSSAMQSAAYKLDVFRLANNLELKVAEKGKKWRRTIWQQYKKLYSGKTLVAFLLIWCLLQLDFLSVKIMAVSLFSIWLLNVFFYMWTYIRYRKLIKISLSYYSLFLQYFTATISVSYPLVLFDSLTSYKNMIYFFSFDSVIIANAWHSLIFVAITLFIYSLHQVLPSELKIRVAYDK